VTGHGSFEMAMESGKDEMASRKEMSGLRDQEKSSLLGRDPSGASSDHTLLTAGKRARCDDGD
jgi:hypothetical protein